VNIQLDFINQSDDVNNSQIVVFTSPGLDKLPLAWLVIQNCGRGDHHPFAYPNEWGVIAADSFGNYSPMLDAEGGQAFAMVRDGSGDVLKLAGASAVYPHIEVANQLPSGTIDAYLCKAGKRYLAQTGLTPGQTAVFDPPAKLWFLVAVQVEEGQVMDNALVEARSPFELSLDGIASADIVMTGGGAGRNAKPFVFTLANVVKA
jgi:hypothetical protein